VLQPRGALNISPSSPCPDFLSRQPENRFYTHSFRPGGRAHFSPSPSDFSGGFPERVGRQAWREAVLGASSLQHPFGLGLPRQDETLCRVHKPAWLGEASGGERTCIPSGDRDALLLRLHAAATAAEHLLPTRRRDRMETCFQLRSPKDGQGGYCHHYRAACCGQLSTLPCPVAGRPERHPLTGFQPHGS
jgi:hypothetical protein